MLSRSRVQQLIYPNHPRTGDAEVAPCVVVSVGDSAATPWLLPYRELDMMGSQVKNHIIGKLSPDPQLASIGGRVRLSDFVNHQNVVLFFMDRFTCSRCWYDAIRLGKHQSILKRYNILVLLIGGGEYLGPATRLAAELDLPFPILADSDEDVWKHYVANSHPSDRYHTVIAVIDDNGILRYLLGGCLSGEIFDAQRLIDAISRLNSSVVST